MGHTESNSMKPAGQRFLFADACTSPGQKDEGCLKCILRVLNLMQDTPANAHHHRAVPLHQRRERGLVIARRELCEQLPVSPGLVVCARHTSDIPDDIAQLLFGHRRRSPSRGCVAIYIVSTPAESFAPTAPEVLGQSPSADNYPV